MDHFYADIRYLLYVYRNIKVYSPFSIDAQTIVPHFTYFDSTGRVMVVLEKNKVVREHEQFIQVLKGVLCNTLEANGLNNRSNTTTLFLNFCVNPLLHLLLSYSSLLLVSCLAKHPSTLAKSKR